MMTDIIYPILQKYYNALNSLNSLNIAKNIFENIPLIDNFFAEFRNITFVMQKSFNTKELKEYYTTKRKEFLNDNNLRWFIDKRNETVKEYPFKLEKEILVYAYLPDYCGKIVDSRLNIDNDVPLETIEQVIKAYLIKYNKNSDIYFSIDILFKENGNEINIYSRIKNGIIIMDNFINEVITDYPCNCSKCKNIIEKIKELKTEIFLKDFTFSWDYTIENNEIIWGQQIEMRASDKNGCPISMSDICIPIDANLPISKNVINDDMELFKFYASMHYTIFNLQKKNIMPTFIIVYEDNTVSYIPFIPTIKTTFYRKAQYVEKIARKKDIRVVYFIGENFYYPIEKIKEIQQPYSQRIKHASTTLLSLNMISKKYEHVMTISFDINNIECEDYAINQINNPYEDINCYWLNPILDVLKEKNLSKH